MASPLSMSIPSHSVVNAIEIINSYSPLTVPATCPEQIQPPLQTTVTLPQHPIDQASPLEALPDHDLKVSNFSIVKNR
jgi:hypothetical protein